MGDVMADQASVGIVMRTRDRPLFVTRALAAVLAQTHAAWRVVLVNDGGDAGALRARLTGAGLVRRLGPERLEIVDHPQSLGRAAAFNRGLARLDTDFVACLDDDDTWDPRFLATLTALHARVAPLVPDLGGVAAGVTALREDVVTDADGTETLVPLGEDGLPNAFHRSDFLLGAIAYATYRHDLYPVQWLLDRAKVAALGGFPEDFQVMEDRAFLLKFVQHNRIAMLGDKLAFHHRRARRAEDAGQSAAMNTLDNPSYDWRLYADLALPTLTTPPGGAAPDLPGLIRAVGASVVKELNDETSALWHKVNGEAKGLRDRLDALEARLGGAAPPPALDLAADRAPFALWTAVAGRQLGWRLAPGTPFLDRLEVSIATAGDGLLMHADPDTRAMVLQVPATGAWCALEVSLAGLAPVGRDVVCDAVLSLAGGGLFETALMLAGARGRADPVDAHVHRAPMQGAVRITRRFTGIDLARAPRPKLSIILPRQAANLRLTVHDLVVSPG